jgi:hypothetical protein
MGRIEEVVPHQNAAQVEIGRQFANDGISSEIGFVGSKTLGIGGPSRSAISCAVSL